MEKTYSQKVARGLEVVGYLMLGPVLIGLFYAGLLVAMGITGGQIYQLFCGLIPFILTAAGVTLLVGYFKRSRDRLSERYFSALWIGTIAFNLLLLLPWLLFALSSVSAAKKYSSGGDLAGLYLSTAVIFGYGAVIGFAFKAYSFEKFSKK